MAMAVYDPFGRRPELTPRFTGAPTERLPYRNVHFLGGLFRLLCPDGCELTSREFDYMTRASFGFSNPMIANELGLATQTVHNQMSKLLPKMEVGGRSELMSTAFNLGYMAISSVGALPNLRKGYGPKENFPIDPYDLQIVQRIGKGLTLAAIGDELSRSDKTIKTRLNNLDLGISGSDTYFAAAVATGQVNPYTCELITDNVLAA